MYYYRPTMLPPPCRRPPLARQLNYSPPYNSLRLAAAGPRLSNPYSRQKYTSVLCIAEYDVRLRIAINAGGTRSGLRDLFLPFHLRLSLYLSILVFYFLILHPSL